MQLQALCALFWVSCVFIIKRKGLWRDISVIWGEVNFHHLFLFLYGLWFAMEVPFFPLRYCLGGGGGGGAQTFFPDIPLSLTLSHTCFTGQLWQLWDIFCPWLTFLLVEGTPSLRLWPSESRYIFPSEFSILSDFLAQDSPSLQGFPAFFIKPRVRFLGNRGCPWDAVICSLGYDLNKGV